MLFLVIVQIPVVALSNFHNIIKNFISCYMVFVKEHEKSLSELKESNGETKEELELANLLREFQDIFKDNIPYEMPPSRGMNNHSIDLIPGITPPNKPNYQVSQAQQEEIMRQASELVDKGVVQSSSSPFCSSMLLVHKKDSTHRMCVDYQALNKITIKNRFLIPRIEDIFDHLQDTMYF